MGLGGISLSCVGASLYNVALIALDRYVRMKIMTGKAG